MVSAEMPTLARTGNLNDHHDCLNATRKLELLKFLDDYISAFLRRLVHEPSASCVPPYLSLELKDGPKD